MPQSCFFDFFSLSPFSHDLYEILYVACVHYFVVALALCVVLYRMSCCVAMYYIVLVGIVVILVEIVLEKIVLAKSCRICTTKSDTNNDTKKFLGKIQKTGKIMLRVRKCRVSLPSTDTDLFTMQSL